MRTYFYTLLIPYLEGTLDEERRQKLEIQLARDPKLAAEAEALRWTTAHLRVRGAEQRAQNESSPAASVWPRLRAQMETTSPNRSLRQRPLLLGGSLVGFAAVAATMIFASSVMHSPAPAPSGTHTGATMQANIPRTNTQSSKSFSSSNLQTAQVTASSSDQLPVHSTQAKHDDVAQKQSPQIARVPSSTDADIHDPFVHSSVPAHTTPPLSVRSSNHQDQIAARDLAPQNGIIRDSQTGVPALTAPFTPSVNEPRSSFKSSPSNHQSLAVSAGATSDQVQSPDPSRLSSSQAISGIANAPALKPSPQTQSKRIAEGAATDEPKTMQPKAVVPASGGGFGGGGRGGFGGGGFGGGLNPNPSAASAPPSPVMPDSLSGHRPTPASESDIDSLRRQRDRPGISLDQQVNLSVALAKAYQTQGESRMALDRWQQALETTVQLPAFGTDDAYHLSLQTLQAAQDVSQLTALQFRLEKRRVQMPNDVLLRRMLASLYDFTGDSDKAYTERMNVITTGKASSEDWYQLGQADTQRNDTAAAVGAFQQALGGGVLAPEHRETARKFVQSTSN